MIWFIHWSTLETKLRCLIILMDMGTGFFTLNSLNQSTWFLMPPSLPKDQISISFSRIQSLTCNHSRLIFTCKRIDYLLRNASWPKKSWPTAPKRRNKKLFKIKKIRTWVGNNKCLNSRMIRLSKMRMSNHKAMTKWRAWRMIKIIRIQCLSMENSP